MSGEQSATDSYGGLGWRVRVEYNKPRQDAGRDMCRSSSVGILIWTTMANSLKDNLPWLLTDGLSYCPVNPDYSLF